jgi:hypothetical protein
MGVASHQPYYLIDPFIRKALSVTDEGEYSEFPEGKNLITNRISSR